MGSLERELPENDTGMSRAVEAHSRGNDTHYPAAVGFAVAVNDALDFFFALFRWRLVLNMTKNRVYHFGAI